VKIQKIHIFLLILATVWGGCSVYLRDQIKIHIKKTGYINVILVGFNDGTLGRSSSTVYSLRSEDDFETVEQDRIFSRWSYNLYVRPGINRKPIDSKKSFIDVSIFRNEIPCGNFKTQIEYSEPGEVEDYREYRVLCKSW
jgi:hypothetical protein